MMKFLVEHELYIVLTIVLLVWAGIAVYLFRLDKKLASIEKKIRKD